MSNTQQIEHHDDERQMADSAAAGLSDNDGFLVPSPIPTRRTRTYSQYVTDADDDNDDEYMFASDFLPDIDSYIFIIDVLA